VARSSALRAALAAATAPRLASGAFAAAEITTGKSNTYQAIDPHNAAAVKARTDGGGTVGKDDKGKDVCITPKKRFDDIRDAIQREKTIKHWPRAWKVRLIHALNPAWDDLYDTLN